MEENNLMASMEEISTAVGVQGKAGVSFIHPVASGDPGPSQPTYCINLSLDPSFPPSVHSSHTGRFC